MGAERRLAEWWRRHSFAARRGTLVIRCFGKTVAAESGMRTASLLLSIACGFGAVLYGQVSKSSGASGEAIYKRQCAGCHGQDGKGQTAMGKTFHLQDLTSSEVQNMSDSQLFDVIARGKGKMPAYENNLGPERIRSVIAYLRELKKP